MRAQGVRSLWVVCDLCRHEAVINVDRFGDDVTFPPSGRAWCAPAAASSARLRGRIGRGVEGSKPLAGILVSRRETPFWLVTLSVFT
jgi:hypothetical protein